MGIGVVSRTRCPKGEEIQGLVVRQVRSKYPGLPLLGMNLLQDRDTLLSDYQLPILLLASIIVFGLQTQSSLTLQSKHGFGATTPTKSFSLCVVSATQEEVRSQIPMFILHKGTIRSVYL